MSLKESDLMRKIMLAVSNVGVRLFRSQVGLMWAGRVERFTNPAQVFVNVGDIVIRNAYPIPIGVVGMSDTGGWTPVIITPQMVGRTLAVSTWCEVKTETGKPTEEQINFISQVNKSGGIGFIARSPEEALLHIQSFRNGLI